MAERLLDDVELRTARMVLRAPGPTDIGGLAEAGSDELTQRWLPLPRPYSAETARALLQYASDGRDGGRGLFRAIELNGRFGGLIDLKRVDGWPRRPRSGT